MIEVAKGASYRIIIVGGGISGLLSAIGIQRLGCHRVVVLENSPSPQTLGGSLVIPPSAARVLDQFGVWERILATDNARNKHTVFRYADGNVLEETNYLAMKSRFGYPIMSITREEYQRILYLEARKAGVEIRFGCLVVRVDVTVPSVTLSSSEEIKGDLVIGADGIKSVVRAAILSGKKVEPIPEAIAYQFKVPSQVMKSNPITAPLMDNNPIHSWYGPGRQIIGGATSREEFYAVTLTIYPEGKDRTADSLDALTPNTSSSYRLGDVGSMRKSINMFEPRVRKLAQLVDPEECFLWKLAYLPKLDTWISPGGRVAVLGDAAHAMVPHLGMGAATAVEDGGVLASCLARAKSLEDIPLALAAYQKIRKGRAEQIQEAALNTGLYKALDDGTEQRERDLKMAERMDPSHPKYSAWKAGAGLDWLYAYDFMEAVSSLYRSRCDH
ncbi:FAD/NAD(P)-binding domain-containing protein [Bimuria novae-zelandiae CBS 107.79]|uniref:FAD/NAD(P)-binding domain-containing protein n=1 Tax=Bimuria novae-zelandiae CBS 107.79 TaxID=1447943 RepID=A0A6A5UHD9_9PLEO|nr:FAD/NAD(P)-binding domain-containing protein [Bimuria novae-zelandiae CBS 107.79]